MDSKNDDFCDLQRRDRGESYQIDITETTFDRNQLVNHMVFTSRVGRTIERLIQSKDFALTYVANNVSMERRSEGKLD